MAYDPEKAAAHDLSLKQLHAAVSAIKDRVSEAIAALPKEMFLDQTKSVFVSPFTFSAFTYYYIA